MKLFNLLTNDTLILTPNRRLAASLLNQFNECQIAQQKTVWQTLDILPLTSWLQRLWYEFSSKEITTLPFLITENQKSILWETILRQSSRSDGLLQISETAKLAESAYELIKNWEVSLNHPDFSTTEDGQAFQEWALQFQKICKKNNWIDNASLPDILKENLIAGKLPSPQKIILAGFTEISPQYLSLFNSFKNADTEIIYYNSEKSAVSLHKISLRDKETEIRTMARWAKNTLHCTDKKRPYLIGCVVPQLEKLRDEVLQIFSDVFFEKGTFTLDHTVLPFNISAGKSLLSFPIVKTAIELLKLTQLNISIETFCHLLKSPFLGEAETEKLKRASFENTLKKANISTLSIKKLLKKNVSHHFAATCPLLAKRMQRYMDYYINIKKTHTMNEWANHFIELLKILGWPGERSLNSQEYQITQRWLDLLLEYSQLDTILETQHFSNAIEWLMQLSATTIFQPQSPEAPIQILGMLEAAELPFEHVWVMGLDDNHWPAAPKPNPLIPQHLQKLLNMPHATTEREYLYCQSLMKQLKNTAAHVIFSYSEKNEDIHLRPSALINDIDTLLTELTFENSLSPAELIFNSKQLENYVDETAPPIQKDEIIQGGTAIFKQQAACPFKAFAEWRLHARFIDSPTLGLRAIDRGNIVHKALEIIWQEIKDSHTLLQLSIYQLKNIIHTAAEQAIQTVMRTSEDSQSNQRYFNLELQRLEKILFDWMQIEKQRPEFKVAFQEHEIDTTIGHIPVKIRVDRIDELADGSQFIIDYKTGQYNEIKKWFSERPDEPQLPLYCVLGGEKITGIAFGQLHPDNMNMTGISKNNINIKSVKTLPEVNYASTTLWNEQLQEWKITLENLSQHFMNGVANVDPKEKEICNHCNLQTFCRVHEK